MANQKHDYHLVNPSPMPIMGTIAASVLVIGLLAYMHEKPHADYILGAGVLLVIATMYLWWRDIVREGIEDKAHSKIVQQGLRIGMALFILSEVMFFFAFFFSFFKAWLMPVDVLDGLWPIAEGLWPPEGIEPFDPWDIPFLNTLILLLSGTTVTWAHHALLHGDREGLIKGLTLTVFLGVCFTGFQVYEYTHAAFGFKDGIYASNFYMATGFHGFHVIVGTIFLFVCLRRAIRGQLTPDGHLGLEFAAWYWHFVDVVWLFLFVFVYWQSS